MASLWNTYAVDAVTASSENAFHSGIQRLRSYESVLSAKTITTENVLYLVLDCAVDAMHYLAYLSV